MVTLSKRRLCSMIFSLVKSHELSSLSRSFVFIKPSCFYSWVFCHPRNSSMLSWEKVRVWDQRVPGNPMTKAQYHTRPCHPELLSPVSERGRSPTRWGVERIEGQNTLQNSASTLEEPPSPEGREGLLAQKPLPLLPIRALLHLQCWIQEALALPGHSQDVGLWGSNCAIR